jgi:hypothetical protein
MQPSPRDQLKSRLFQEEVDEKELTQLFTGFENEGRSELEEEDLKACTAEREVHEFFAMRGIEIKDEALFARLMIEKAEMNTSQSKKQIERLANDCVKMRGTASTLDLHILGYEMKQMHRQSLEMLKQLMEGEKQILSRPGSPQAPAPAKADSFRASASRAPAIGAANGDTVVQTPTPMSPRSQSQTWAV